MNQLNLFEKVSPYYYRGLELKPKRGCSMMFSSTGFRIKKYVISGEDRKNLIQVCERNLDGFKWLLTEKEIEKYFEPFNQPNKK